MKRRFKHPIAQRLYWRQKQQEWRTRNPERAREIRRRYWRKKRGYYLLSEKPYRTNFRTLLSRKSMKTVKEVRK